MGQLVVKAKIWYVLWRPCRNLHNDSATNQQLLAKVKWAKYKPSARVSACSAWLPLPPFDTVARSIQGTGVLVHKSTVGDFRICETRTTQKWVGCQELLV